jgi:hypothetical protein
MISFIFILIYFIPSQIGIQIFNRTFYNLNLRQVQKAYNICFNHEAHVMQNLISVVLFDGTVFMVY